MKTPEHLIDLKEAAKRAGKEVHTVRRQLKALERKYPGILVRFSERKGAKIWVNTIVAEQALAADPEARDAELDALTSDLRLLDGRLTALRNVVRKQRKEFDAHVEHQTRVNSLMSQQLQITAELQALLSSGRG